MNNLDSLRRTVECAAAKLIDLQQVMLVLTEKVESDLRGFSKYGDRIPLEDRINRLELTAAMIHIIYDQLHTITEHLDTAVNLTYTEEKK